MFVFSSRFISYIQKRAMCDKGKRISLGTFSTSMLAPKMQRLLKLSIGKYVVELCEGRELCGKIRTVGYGDSSKQKCRKNKGVALKDINDNLCYNYAFRLSGIYVEWPSAPGDSSFLVLVRSQKWEVLTCCCRFRMERSHFRPYANERA